MRRFLSPLLLTALALPAGSIASCPARAAEPPSVGAVEPHGPELLSAHPVRQTWEQHFNVANLGHDGHLTLEEAKGGYALVARHFDDIDADHKGYVTRNDIRAWRVMKKSVHRLTRPPVDRLMPRNAMQFVPMGRTAVSARPGQTVALPSDPPRRPDNAADND